METRKINAEETAIPGQFAHIVINTRRFEAMKQWYGCVLGMKVVVDNGFLCFLTYDDEHHRMALVNLPDLKERSDEYAGVNHFAYTMPDLASLLGTYARLKTQDILPWWCINHGPTTSMYYHDPDNNSIELQVDNFDADANLQWMVSDAFKENPLGVEYDPDLLINRFESGVALDELLVQGSAPKAEA